MIPGTVFDSPVSVLSGAETLGGQLQAWQAEGQAAQEPTSQSPVEASAAPVLEARPETAAEVPSAPAGQFAQTQAMQVEVSPSVS